VTRLRREVSGDYFDDRAVVARRAPVVRHRPRQPQKRFVSRRTSISSCRALLSRKLYLKLARFCGEASVKPIEKK
jgi:hypothetical protein